MLRQLAIRGFTTIKSNNDHLKDQTVLNLLKKVPLLGEQRVKLEMKLEEEGEKRIVSFQKLSRILELHSSDPLNWDVNTLCRIFKVPEDYCDNILKHVYPLTRYITNESDKCQETLRIMYVIDVGRLKTDTLYHQDVQNLKFLEEHPTRTSFETTITTKPKEYRLESFTSEKSTK